MELWSELDAVKVAFVVVLLLLLILLILILPPKPRLLRLRCLLPPCRLLAQRLGEGLGGGTGLVAFVRVGARRSGPGVPQALDSESPPPLPSGPPSAAPVLATVGMGGKASVPASSAFHG